MRKTLHLTYDKSTPFTLDFEPKDIVRFIYLATFLQSDSSLKDKAGRYIEWCDIPRVLNLEERFLVDFMDNIRSNNLVQEDNHGKLYIRGNILSTSDCNGCSGGYDKVLLDVDSIQELYETIRPQKHKALGYLFMAIPYVNKELNCLCKNPSQQDAGLIIPMSIHEYCEYIGYNIAHYGDLEKILLELRFGNEPLVTNIDLAGKDAYFINPRVYYGGKQWNVVYRYAAFEQPSIYEKGEE